MTAQDDMAAFRAQELLFKRATEGLDDHESADLAALGADHDISFDLAAASIDIATLRSIDELPAGVADKILIAAGVESTVTQAMPAQVPMTLAGVVPPRPIGRPTPTSMPTPSTSMPLPAPSTSMPVPTPQRDVPDELAAARAKKPSRAPMYIAYVLAAAGIVLAVGAVLWANSKPPVIRDRIVERVVPPPVVPAAEARAALLATAKDVTVLPWTASQDAAAKGASGDVVWSPSEQKGFMRFVGLAVNDPKQLQYQLWIFDKNRDQAFPVDGGVFDITPAGEVIVPISAKLPVGEPVLFAVTVEKPGGVVVSKRERIVVTAAPKA